MTRKQGLFISVEGIDGAGKSTQLVSVREWAYSKGWDVSDVVSVREPGGTALGEKIRSLFLEAKAENLTTPIQDVMMLLVAKKALWDTVIKPALVAGKVVVADRWTDTLYAYQGYGFELGTYKIHRMLDIVGINLWPDVTIWIDTPVEVARARMDKERGKNEQNALDKKGLPFFTRVRQGFFERSQEFDNRIMTVDGSLRENEVARRIHDSLNARLKNFLYA